MTYRRNRTSELFLLILVSIFLLYGYYSMQDLRTKLTLKHRETEKTHHYARLLREQLKVLYKHTGKLEQALKTEKTTHKTTKQQLVDKVEEFQLNATKTKHEAVNRFNALDTDYKMLKANYEETYQNYAVLQQQHVRLNEAHKNLMSSSKSECDKVKFDMENETLHLHSRIQALYRENMESHQLSEQYYAYYQESLNQVKSANDIAQKYQNKVKYYVGHLHRMQQQLKTCRKAANESSILLPTSLMSENADVLTSEAEIVEKYQEDTAKDELSEQKDTAQVQQDTEKQIKQVEQVTEKNDAIVLTSEMQTSPTNRSLVIHDDDSNDATTTERPFRNRNDRNIVPAQHGRPIQQPEWSGGVGTSNLVTPLSKPTDGGYLVNNNQQINIAAQPGRYRQQDAYSGRYEQQSVHKAARAGYAQNGGYEQQHINNIARGGYAKDGGYVTTNSDEGSFGGSSKNDGEEDKLRGTSGTNMELNELLDNKPLYVSLHQNNENQQVRMKRQQTAHGDVDNKDIREVNLDDEGESKLVMNSNSSPI